MGRLQRQGLLQLLLPGAAIGAGQPLDQIQAPAAQLTALLGLTQPTGGLQQIAAAVAPPTAA